MQKRVSIAVVGMGRLGSTLASTLSESGYEIREIVVRNRTQSLSKARKIAGNARVSTSETAQLDADLIWMCVPDVEIAETARKLAGRTEWKGKSAFHSSGALNSDELRAFRKRGAAVASVHPFMSFVHGAKPSLHGVPFGLEGDGGAIALARCIVRDLGGTTFLVPKAKKTLYHAWGSFASPLFVALLAIAEEIAADVGIARGLARKRMLPIVIQTLANYAELGAASAFSGPIVRGDVQTVRSHLKALRKNANARNAYVALADAALAHLPAENKKKLKKVIRG